MLSKLKSNAALVDQNSEQYAHILFILLASFKLSISNNVDVIVFSVHEEYYKQCQDSPIGTYITPVPNFLQGYLQYYMQIQEDKGNEDYELPEVADYAYCTRVVIQNEERWLQIGCSDDDSLSIAVNIYDDNTCTTRSTIEGGYDDANIDVSEIQVRIFGGVRENKIAWKQFAIQ